MASAIWCRAWTRPSAKRNSEVYYPLNLDFHGRILELSGNSRLITMYRRLIDELHLCRRRNLLEESGMVASNEEHRRIVGAADALG